MWLELELELELELDEMYKGDNNSILYKEKDYKTRVFLQSV